MTQQQEEKSKPTVTIREADGTIVQPWSDVPDLQPFEWIRNAEEVVSTKTRRVELATYVDVQEVPKVILGKLKGKYTVATFQTDQNGDVYDIAKRLADRRKVKKYDKVLLHMIGCCNIENIEKVKNE